MAVAIKPLEDRIVVKANEAETTTASGLVIPDTAKEKPQEGTVVAVGPGRFDDGARVPMDVKVGDVVLYSKYGGTEVKYNNEEYLVSLLATFSRLSRSNPWAKCWNSTSMLVAQWNVELINSQTQSR